MNFTITVCILVRILQLHSLYIGEILVRILQLHSRKIGQVIDENFTFTQSVFW